MTLPRNRDPQKQRQRRRRRRTTRILSLVGAVLAAPAVAVPPLRTRQRHALLLLRTSTVLLMVSLTVLLLLLRIDPVVSLTVAPASCAGTRTTTVPVRPECLWRTNANANANANKNKNTNVEPSVVTNVWTLSMTSRGGRSSKQNRDSSYDNNDDDPYDEEDDYYYPRDSNRDYNDDPYGDDNDDYSNSTSYYNNDAVGNRKGPSSRRQSRSRNQYDEYYDEIDESPDEDYAYDDMDMDDIDDESPAAAASRDRGGYYRVSFPNNDAVDPSETEIDWEVCTAPPPSTRTDSFSSSSSADSSNNFPPALVVLPPAAVTRPTAVIHFVGGTVFGSNPRLWYGGLLESIVRSTSAVVVATPVPVTVWKNPLQHFRLARALQRSLEHAWETVLEDEYSPEVMESVPVCGIGHSLGARLLTVLATLDGNKSNSGSNRNLVPPYKSMCLVSFTNYGASVGIPGVGALLKQSRANRKRRPPAARKPSPRKSGRRYNDRGYNNYNRYDDDDDDYDDDDFDAEWAEMVDDLRDTFNAQAYRIKTALTPDPNELEFVPTPERLWKAIEHDHRYAVNTTLVVQFDDDPIDQGSKLASVLVAANASDVRFARLRGNHLTPVTGVLDEEKKEKGGEGGGATTLRRKQQQQRQQQRQQKQQRGLQSVLATTLKGTQATRRDTVALRDLRRSLVSYITDVVTK